MIESDLTTPLTFRSSTAKTLRLLLTCIVFVSLGLWLGISKKEASGYFGAAFFGLGIPIFALQLIPGSTYLRIDDTGLTYCTLFRKTHLPWDDIAEFRVLTTTQSGIPVNKTVGLRYAPEYERVRLGRAVAMAMAGCEGALPQTYGKRADDLVMLLNARLALHRATIARAESPHE